MSLFNVRIILIEPSHPGNIGAAARAMKNMGLHKLYMVSPERFPDNEANYRSAGADDLLSHAIVTDSIDEAVSGCHLLVGTSARIREFPQPMLNPRELTEKLLEEPKTHEIGIIFGPEHSGLPNHILERCHYHVMIPSVESFSSLNLAAAVQVIAYEVRMASLIQADKATVLEPAFPMPTADELEGLYRHIESTMIDVGFLNPQHPRGLMKRVRRLFHRARVDRDDVDLLRGMMNAVMKRKNNT